MNVSQTPGPHPLIAYDAARLNQPEGAQHRGPGGPRIPEVPQPLALHPAPGTPGAPIVDTGRALDLPRLTEDSADAIVGELRDDPQNPVQALLDAWGSDSPEHDLNNDGTVNILDLTALLSELVKQAHVEDAPQTDSSHTTDPIEATDARPDFEKSDLEQRLRNLLNAWGSDDAASDLNGDGTVNVFDLNALLHQYAAAQGQSLDPATNEANLNLSDPESGVPGETPGDPLTIQGLLDAWNTQSTMYDLNEDGTVNMFDLLALLDRISSSSNDAPPVKEDVVDPLTTEHTYRRRVRERALDNMAERLVNKLHERGFDKQPPGNLDSMLRRLNLQPDQHEALKKRIFATYPTGIGINTYG